MAVVKLNEAMLFQMGFDRVAIDALRHLYTQVGNEVGAPTLPQVTQQVVTVIQTVDSLDLAPPAYPYVQTSDIAESNSAPPAYDPLQQQGDQSPPYITHQAAEYIETQIRSAQEEIAILRRKINDLEQGAIL